MSQGEVNRCAGPWDVLKKNPVEFANMQGIVICQFSTDGKLCEALTSEDMRSTPCIKIPESKDPPTGMYAAKVVGGAVVFDADTNLLLHSPNLDARKVPVEIRPPYLVPKLVLFLQNVGDFVSIEQITQRSLPEEGRMRNIIQTNASSTVGKLNKRLGISPTEKNPSGKLIEHVQGKGYRLKAPR